MIERSILNENIVEFELNATTKKEAIDKLSYLLFKEDYLNDVDGFIKDVFIRESEGITGIGDGIAIPHGKSSAVKKVGLAIGKVAVPIEWGSLDDSKVEIIFLFAVSDTSEGDHEHLRLLSKVATKLGNENNVKALKNAENFDDIKAVFDF